MRAAIFFRSARSCTSFCVRPARFDGRTVDETLDQVLAANPKPVDRIRPETPPALVEIVRRAMAKEPAARYQKAAELRNALADFVDGSRAPAADATNGTRAIEPRAATAGRTGTVERACNGGDRDRCGGDHCIGRSAAPRTRTATAQERPLQPVTAALPITARTARRDAASAVGGAAAAAAASEAKSAEAKAAARRKSEPPPAPVAPPRDGRSCWPFRRGARLASMGRRAGVSATDPTFIAAGRAYDRNSQWLCVHPSRASRFDRAKRLVCNIASSRSFSRIFAYRRTICDWYHPFEALFLVSRRL